jgi:hypothetical protein
MTKNRLTLYILLALLLGVIVGYIYNTQVINGYNTQLTRADVNIKTIDQQIVLIKDTSRAEYRLMKTARAAQVKNKKEADTAREDKLEVLAS